MFHIIGSGRFITAPIVTEEGVPIQDLLVLLEANPDKGVTLPPQSRSDAENSEHSTGSASTANSLDYSSTNSSEMVKEPVKSGPLDKKVIQWMLISNRTLMFYENKDNLSKLWDILAVYAWIDEDVGYCQGMSDLCSPMIILLDDEVDAFWCFERLMRRLVSISLWPRFKMVFDMHLNNMRNANVKTLWEDDVHPHYVMRRYTEFTASLIHINVEFGDGQLELNLQRSRMAIDDLLIKLEKTFTKPKLQTLFLINNYDMTISVLKVTICSILVVLLAQMYHIHGHNLMKDMI